MLWLLQLLMAFFYAMHGRAMLFRPDPLPEPMAWMHDIWAPLRAFVGLAEIAAAAALVLPGLAQWLRPERTTALVTSLTPLAAVGLAFVMASAFVFHLLRGELGNLPSNVVLVLLLLSLGWLRWKKVPL